MYVCMYVCMHVCMYVCMYMLYNYIILSCITYYVYRNIRLVRQGEAAWILHVTYGQFSKNHVCFCGLDPGNLKFETVRTHKHICF